MDVHRREPDVVNRGEVLEKKVELEHHPHFPLECSRRPPARRQTLSRDAIDEHGAIVEPLEARDCPEDGRFAGSRQAHEGEHFAAADGDIDAAEYLAHSSPEAQATSLHDGTHEVEAFHRLSSPRATCASGRESAR